MSVTATHQGIRYEMQSLNGGWQWSFQPPQGPRRTGTVVGEPAQAMAVVRRAIEVSMLINAA